MKLQVTVEGKSYEVEVEVLEEHDGVRTAPFQSAQIHAAGSSDGSEKVCRSPVTGLAIKVNVEPGQQVQPGDLILVLEAMKMETNITAHSAGRVKSVHVAAGDSVKEHQVLVEFE